MTISIIDKLIHAWQSGDPERVVALFHPDAQWVIDGQTLEGRDEIALAVGASMGVSESDARAMRILLRRAFSDLSDPNWCAAEWAFRVQSAKDGGCRECEQGVLIHEREGRIAYMRTHNDKFRACATSWDAPLRPESRPLNLPTPARAMTLDEILALQHRHVMQGWRLGDAEAVTSSHAPGSVILNAWETVRGHDEIRTSVGKYIQNYIDTEIEVHRVVYDGQNIAVNQTWRCTNRLTGARSGDQDLIIGVMQDGKIWYWREYFDPDQSAQTLAQTHFGVLQNSA
jgi:limonene-1,2-epoxide hydrolase